MEPTAFIERVLGSLWRASWQTSVLVLLVLAAQWLCGRRLAPKWRYALWFLVVVRLLMPVTPSSPWSLFNYGTVEDFSVSNFGLWTRGEPIDMTHQERAANPAVAQPASSAEQTPSRREAPSNLDQNPKPASRSAVQSTFVFLRQNVGWIWFLGVLALSMRLAWGNYLFGLQLRRRRPMAEPAVLELFEECRWIMGIRRRLTLLEAPELDGPALFGCFRLKLLLPEKLIETFSASELRHVFLHELAHIRRWDAAVNWLTTVLQTLHWFNPILWLAFHRMRADREVACDELALARANEAESKPYGQTVIKVLEGFTGPTAIPGLVGILEDKTQIKRRIHMIAEFKKTSPWPVMAAVVLVALGLVSLTDAQTKKGAEVLVGKARGEIADQPVSNTPEVAKSSVIGSKSPANGRAATSEKTAAGLTLRKIPDVPPEFKLITARNVSRDGRYLMGYVGVLDLTTGQIRKFEGFEKSVFTPDGKRIVGSRRFPPKNDPIQSVVVLDLETGKILEIYRNEDIEDIGMYMDCSSDGKKVVASFYKKDKTTELVMISVSDGSVRVLKVFPPEISVTDFRFSPDGNWVAYGFTNSGKANSLTERDSDIHLIAADGSRERPVIEHPAKDHLLGWAPFGDRILFASDRRGTWDIFMTAVADGKSVGEPVLIKSAVSSGFPAYADTRTGLGFTDSGAFFYISENDSSDVYIAALDPKSGKVQGKPSKATRMETPNEEPAWSHDSRFLAYVTRLGAGAVANGFLRIRDMETGSIRDLSTDAGRVSSPRWAPDGHSIFAQAYHPPKVPAHRINVASGKSAMIWEDDLSFGRVGRGTWSLDGKSIYQPKGTNRYAAYASLVQHDLVNRGTTNEFRIPLNWDGILSPDCEQFVFSVTKTNGNSLSRTINVASVSDGKTRALTSISGPESRLRVLQDNGLGWTPDNRYVLFVKGDPNSAKTLGLWRVPVAGGEPEPLGLEMEGLRTPVISPDGRWIAVAAGGNKTELWVMENFLPKDTAAAK